MLVPHNRTEGQRSVACSEPGGLPAKLSPVLEYVSVFSFQISHQDACSVVLCAGPPGLSSTDLKGHQNSVSL